MIKVLEYVILERLNSFLESHDIISSRQYVFRKDKSTNSALVSIYNEVLHQLENKKYPLGEFCDLSKAYDCDELNLLVEKLEWMEIRGG